MKVCLGSQRKEDMVQVLGSPLFISYYHQPKITDTGTHPCDLYQFPLASGALPAKRCTPYGKTGMPRYAMVSLLALVLGTLQNFLCQPALLQADQP